MQKNVKLLHYFDKKLHGVNFWDFVFSHHSFFMHTPGVFADLYLCQK